MISIKNFTEDLVLQQLDEVMGMYRMCNCDKCKSDVAALALNALPPMYVSTDKGATYLKANLLLEQQLKADVLAAISHAVAKVHEEVRHE